MENTNTAEKEKQLEIVDGRKWHFTIIENVVIEDERLTGPDLLVYTILCYHSDRSSGLCFPSLETICKKARLGKTTVIKVLNHLIESGYISKESRKNPKTKRQQSNIYKIIGVQSEPSSNQYHGSSASRVQINTSNKNQQEQEPQRGGAASAALSFLTTFKKTVSESMLSNPRLESRIVHMLHLPNKDEIINPVAYLSRLLRLPDEELTAIAPIADEPVFHHAISDEELQKQKAASDKGFDENIERLKEIVN